MFIGGARGLPSKGPAPRPRPALPPALPAPRGTPTYRPGQSVNNAAVQRYEPAPVRAAQHQAAQRAAYVAAPHHYGPVTPPVNVRRSTVNTTRSPAHATTQRLAKAIGQPRQSMAALEQSVFSRMARAGVLAPGAKLPKLVVDKADPSWMASYGPGALAEYVTPGSGPGGRVVHIPPSVAKNQSARPWVQQALVHEIAHTMQNKDAMSTDALREGGAQAFTEGVVGRVLPKQQHYGPGDYSDYVDQMHAREPTNWITQGQFQPGRRAPAVNAPGTPSFALAMRGVGRRAGGAVRFAGEKPDMVQQDQALQAALKRRRRA